MNTVVRNPVTAVWVLLVTATCVTGWLAETEHGVRWASVAILLIAVVKIWLIMWRFMELGSAPLAWRLALAAWLAIVAGVVLFNYWL